MDDSSHDGAEGGPVRELKIRAEILHKRVQEGDPGAALRVRALPGLLRDGAIAAEQVKRKHCLAVVAREVGFSGWEHALRVLGGDRAEGDLGEALYPRGSAAYLNHWFARYPEARAHLDAHGGYLLAYRRHFFIAERPFVEQLGLDPDDPDWDAIGHDWAQPRSVEARTRLYARLFRATRAA